MSSDEHLLKPAGPLSAFLARVKAVRDEWREKDKQEWEECEEKEFEPNAYWFRGVSKVEYELKPKIYRKSGYTLRKYPRKKATEDEIRRGFKSRATQLMTEPYRPEDEKGWYFLMQHYGAPTRLLDWTDGALLGLYFAVRTMKEPRDAAVWMLDPSWLNEKTLEDSYLSGVALPEWKETDPWFPQPFEEMLHPASPLAIDPPHVARRLTAQRSHFTIHGTDRDALDTLAGQPNSRLVRIVVRANDVIDILDDLETCGISETTVFPDLEGLSKELMHEWGGE
jgi:hypothetical protein